MRITFLFGEWAAGGKRFDVRNLKSSPTGLTGSDVSFFRIAQGLAARGMEITVFAPVTENCDLEGVSYRDISQVQGHPTPDVAYSWCDPTPLHAFPDTVLRMCNQQFNDFSYCPQGFETWVDVWTSPSATHREKVGSLLPDARWEIVNNGCDIHPILPKIPGRVIWTSSFDRGLHWLLSIWPDVRLAVPEAELHVFYSMKKWLDIWNSYDHNSADVMASLQYRRAMFINQSLQRLRNHGVQLRDQVSRQQVENEYAQAEVLAYPCDTISFTEGFSVSILDACSFGCVPVISDADALKELYCSHVPHVNVPMASSIGQYKSLLIETLQDRGGLPGKSRSAWEASHGLTWENSVEQVLSVIRRYRGSH